MIRVDPDLQGDELGLLTQFLDYHRATVVLKIQGLSHEQLNRTAVPPSAMTLAGLVKHLALVEDDWFQVRLLGRPDPDIWANGCFDEDPDWEWHSVHLQQPDELITIYEGACARSRLAVVEIGGDLDARSRVRDRRTGGFFTLRWILLHMIEETSRHNGHVDLMREVIDGAVGP